MFWWIALAIFLYILCAALIVFEILIPSFGILSVCALACLVGGAWIFFSYGQAIGYVGLLVAVVLIPIVLVIIYKLMQKTSLGKAIFLDGPDIEAGGGIPDSDELGGLLGKVGKVISDLRPVGSCDFDGKRVECVAEANFIEADTTVKVIKVESTQVTVREVRS